MNAINRNKTIIITSFFTALTAIGAYLKIPLPHIPITLQTFFVILSGNFLGFKFGAISQLLYLVLGLIGIPIFAYGGGPGYIFQPTFGYLLGYPFSAFTIGMIVKLFLSNSRYIKTSRMKAFFTFLISDSIGILVIFVFGLAYLAINIKLGLYMHLDQFMSLKLNWADLIKSAILIFIPIDFIKAVLAAWLTIYLRKLQIAQCFI